MSVATGALIPRVLAPAKLRRIGQQRRLVTGLVITVVVTALAIIGRWLAPYGENEIVGKPFTMEGSWLGTDYLGQDVWSRVLAGGGSILLISVLATALGMVLGIVIGVVAAYTGGWLDEAIMRLNDVALAFPQILLALLVLTAVDQPAWWMIVLLVGVSHAPRVARVARGVALGIVSRDFVHSAEALGESRLRVIVAEVLPNMNAPLLAEAGLRLTYSIGMVAGIGFLGFATNPGAADWGQMINENRLALLVQPWGVLAPVILIGIFTVGTNLMADGIAQLAGRGD
jgi:peptide/nickel transport system permease protein